MKIFIIVLLVTSGVFIFIRQIEKKVVFFPMREIETTPAAYGMAYEEVFFKSTDGCKLHGWFLPVEGAAWTILFCHGNAGNISHRLEKISIFRDLGLQVFLFDYRGYGRSAGSPDEKGVYRDAEAAFDYLVREKHIEPSRIVLFGESLGGAVAIDLAGKRPAGGLIAESTIFSAEAMAGHMGFPAPFLLNMRFDAGRKIKTLKTPKLILHSVDDEIVPYAQGRMLFEAAAGPKAFAELRGSHNSTFLDSTGTYKRAVRDFLN